MRIGILKRRAEMLCPFCRAALDEEGDLSLCSVCKTVHHLACWQENGRCSIHGCNGIETIIEKHVIASYRWRRRLAVLYNPNFVVPISCLASFVGVFVGVFSFPFLIVDFIERTWLRNLPFLVLFGSLWLLIVPVLSILLHVLLSRCPVCFHFLKQLPRSEISFCPHCNARFVTGQRAVAIQPSKKSFEFKNKQ
jgi:hypothetical protein